MLMMFCILLVVDSRDTTGSVKSRCANYLETRMAGGWGCPHEVNDKCTKVNDLPCDPGMKGCVLAGRYVFANEDKNRRLRAKQARGNGQTEGDDSPGMPP
jgi:hypothetical protein